jgi:hypothetical protein
LGALVDDRDIAAALVLSMEVGLFSAGDAMLVIDREIGARASPEPWFIEASLAKTPQDLLHVLRARAEGHPMLHDSWPLFEAMEKALDAGIDPIDVACRVKKIYPYGEWPREVDQYLYDVYEEATCAHEHGGVPQPEVVEKALRALFEAAKRSSSWRSVLDGLLPERRAAEQ